MSVVQDQVAAESSYETVRRTIAEEFARALVIIDDDVYQNRQAGDPLHPLITKMMQACEARGVACHMHQYPPVTFNAESPDTENAVQRAVELASRADIAIIDWSIGPTRETESCEHAVEIVRRLSDANGMRFVVVYTNDTKLDEIDGILQQRLGAKALQPPAGITVEGDVEEEEENPELVRGSATNNPVMPPHSLHIDNRVFIFVRNKDTFEPEALLTDLVLSLQVALPDLLHWAAMELIGRLRTVMPEVLSALPINTDIALCHQMLFQRDNEVAYQVAEVLLDELLLQIAGYPLTAVADDTLVSLMKTRMVQGLTPPDNTRLVPGVTVPATCIEHWRGVVREELRKKENLTGRYFPNAGKPVPAAAKYLEGVFQSVSAEDACLAWAAARESHLISMPPPSELWPGCMLLREGGDPATSEWFLCITPACDCYGRTPGSGYLFVRGTLSTDRSTPGQTQTCLYYDKKVFHITWDSSDLLVRPYPDTADGGQGYRFVGALRDQYTMRVIQRIWAFQSRVGVDTSELIRAKRGEQ